MLVLSACNMGIRYRQSSIIWKITGQFKKKEQSESFSFGPIFKTQILNPQKLHFPRHQMR